MPLDVGGIDSLSAYKLCLIHRAASLRKMADTNFKKTHAQYKMDYDKHFRFEPQFAMGHYVLVESLAITDVCCSL